MVSSVWPVLSARILFRRLRVFSIKSATMAISVCWPCAPPDGWWMSTMEFGRHRRLPLAPLDSSTAAIEAHSPRQMVDTSHLMKSIVSRMARPAVTEPPGELMYREMSLSGSALSRCSSCATTELATLSSICSPRKITRSLSRRE